jgi:glycosyltransferase involved in cell wall biosynthesis
MDKIVKANPKITVLMPVYNCELYIKEAVESVLNQTYADFEFLIIDDASSDETVSILKLYTDARIQLIVKSINSGYTNSLNMGLQLARGKYIARMDGDDISLPERFEKQMAFLETNPDFVLCGSLFKVIGSDVIKKLPEHYEEIKLGLLRGNCIAHPSVMMRKQILDEFSIVYDVSKEPAEDFDLWVRLLSLGKLHNLQEVLLNYRVHTTQVSQQRALTQIQSALESRLQMLKYLNCTFDSKESDLLKKIMEENILVTFDEIKDFFVLKEKMVLANSNNFFDVKGFDNYLDGIENKLIKRYFFNREKFSPIIYIQYLKIKSRLEMKIKTILEMKLMVKSIFFYKVK